MQRTSEEHSTCNSPLMQKTTDQEELKRHVQFNCFPSHVHNNLLPSYSCVQLCIHTICLGDREGFRRIMPRLLPFPPGCRDSTKGKGSGTHPDEPDGTGPPHLKSEWDVGDALPKGGRYGLYESLQILLLATDGHFIHFNTDIIQ